MKIDRYISELLYDHDCVIVTDLGGFITHYRPATINPAVNTISPPSKKLAFNASLIKSDGLLAYHISDREALNYAEASKLIADYAAQAKEQMLQGKKLKIEKVGMLYIDKEKNIQFLPDQNANYLIDSFGLTAIHAPVLKREVPVLAITEEEEEINTYETVEPSNREIRIFKWKVLEVIPAAAVLTLLLMVPPALDRFNTNMSSLLPFSRMNEYVDDLKGAHKERTPVVVEYKNPFEIPRAYQPQSTETVPDEIASETPTELQSNDDVVEENPLAEINNNVVDKDATTSSDINISKAEENIPPASVESVAGYHIIGGSFRSIENAQNYATQLKAQNIDAEVIGQNSSGLHLVSLFHSGNFEEAKSALSEIKSGSVATAWIYRK